MLIAMDERELHCPEEQPVIGWRLFRARRSDEGFVLAAPLIHNPEFERFLSRTIDAICYEGEHPAPAPGCRCGLYAAVKGTLDSLSGYVRDSAHDRDPPVYAEVACTGRIFVDARGLRAQRIEIRRLATSATVWPTVRVFERAVKDLMRRYAVEVFGLEALPDWVQLNKLPRGRRPEADEAALNLDALVMSLAPRPSPPG